MEGVRGLKAKLVIVVGEQAQYSGLILSIIRSAPIVRSVLGARLLGVRHKLNGEAFLWVLGQIETRPPGCYATQVPTNKSKTPSLTVHSVLIMNFFLGSSL